jgi:hypothetical protein
MPPRTLSARYGIAEWFGKDITALSPEERQAFGQLSVQQMETAVRSLADAPPCPFRSTPDVVLPCNKKGGVCSLRLYRRDPTEMVAAIDDDGGALRTLCPNRFLQECTIPTWVGKDLLGTGAPLMVEFLEGVQAEEGHRLITSDGLTTCSHIRVLTRRGGRRWKSRQRNSWQSGVAPRPY